jgi:hypothetical protein
LRLFPSSVEARDFILESYNDPTGEAELDSPLVNIPNRVMLRLIALRSLGSVTKFYTLLTTSSSKILHLLGPHLLRLPFFEVVLTYAKNIQALVHSPW